MKRPEHVPIAVDVRLISDDLLMETIRDFAKELAPLRPRRIEADLSADEAGRYRKLSEGGAVMVADAWRRGLLDDLLLGGA